MEVYELGVQRQASFFWDVETNRPECDPYQTGASLQTVGRGLRAAPH